jgi:hypothetical protein
MPVGAFAKRTHAARKANPPQPILKRTTNRKRNPPIPPISTHNKNPQAPEPKEFVTLDFTPVEAKYTEHSNKPRPPARAKARPRTETNTQRIMGDPEVVKALAKAKRAQKKADDEAKRKQVNQDFQINSAHTPAGDGQGSGRHTRSIYTTRAFGRTAHSTCKGSVRNARPATPQGQQDKGADLRPDPDRHVHCR